MITNSKAPTIIDRNIMIMQTAKIIVAAIDNQTGAQ